MPEEDKKVDFFIAEVAKKMTEESAKRSVNFIR